MVSQVGSANFSHRGISHGWKKLQEDVRQSQAHHHDHLGKVARAILCDRLARVRLFRSWPELAVI